MTKAELTGAAFVKLTGGYPSMDSSTWWEDVDLLIAPAVNFVMIGDYFMTKRDEGEEKIIQPMFVQTFYDVPVVFDSARKRKKFTLPKRPLAFPKNRAVPFVGTDCNQYIPVEQSGSVMQKYYKGLKQDQTSYSLEGMIGWLFNPEPLVEFLTVKEIVNASEIGDDEEIPLPEGGELQVIDLMVQFFTGQKALPKDYYNTGNEPQPNQA